MRKKIALMVYVTSVPLLCAVDRSALSTTDRKMEFIIEKEITHHKKSLQPASHHIVSDLPNTTSNKSTKHKISVNITNKTLQEKTKTITIKNGITKDMTGYTYFGTTYYPTFSIRINNIIIKSGQEITIMTTNNIVEAEYEYSFAKGLYQGKEIIKIDVTRDNIENGELTFAGTTKNASN